MEQGFGYPDIAVAPVSSSNSTNWIAIIISVIALIAVIIVIVVIVANQPVVPNGNGISQRWAISTTTATSGAVSFLPTSNSMLQIPAGNAAYQINIGLPATGDHSTGSMFMVDNTGNGQAITVTPVSGQNTMIIRGSSATTVTIPANNTAQFIWSTPTSFRLLSVAASP